MTTQIAVRLPDKLVAFMDEAVSKQIVPSRTALVTSAVEREMRRLLAEHDAKILREKGTHDELDELVTWTERQLETESVTPDA
ncbi:MAG: hypothetical protein GX483_02225 [Actinomycetaceae bacterium]|nr:hypothetical protein [Actinomycetaceae bacterium]